MSGIGTPGNDTITLKLTSDPNELRILVPALETLVRIEGAEDIEFRNLQIAHSRTLFGRYDQHKDWPGAIRAWDKTFPDKFPEGLTVPQSAPFTGAAIHVSNSRKIRLIDCRVSGTGGYAIRLSSNSHQCVIEHCKLTDLGAGGVNIDPETRRADTDYPTANIVRETIISHGGATSSGGMCHSNCRFIRQPNSE